jgi:hypothetical protein
MFMLLIYVTNFSTIRYKGNGMQTWEYSPEFKIRSYAFVLPFVPFCKLLAAMGCDDMTIFFSIKLLLGQGFAWACSRFLQSLQHLCGRDVMMYSFVFILAAPGIFFSSTAYLPSAVCSTFVMAAVHSWAGAPHPRRGGLSGYLGAIFFGCLAVVASGW